MSHRRGREPPRVWAAEPAPELECIVCEDVFTDPVTLACGHTFCRACAVHWFNAASDKLCPLARCPVSANSQPAALPTVYIVKGMVDNLRVHCRFGLREDERGRWTPDAEGCQAQLSRDAVAAHEAACEHAFELCPFAGCGVERRRRDADAHDAAAAVAHARGELDARLLLLTQLAATIERFDALEARASGERDARLALAEQHAEMSARFDALEAHARAERDARLALKANMQAERDARLTLEAQVLAERAAASARFAALKASTSVRFDALEARLAALVPGSGSNGGHALPPSQPDGRTLVSASDDEMLVAAEAEMNSGLPMYHSGGDGGSGGSGGGGEVEDVGDGDASLHSLAASRKRVRGIAPAMLVLLCAQLQKVMGDLPVPDGDVEHVIAMAYLDSAAAETARVAYVATLTAADPKQRTDETSKKRLRLAVLQLRTWMETNALIAKPRRSSRHGSDDVGGGGEGLTGVEAEGTM